jgi:hypothetical protein
MASGGFHGGSSHSGSFHSSGGGGFSGGGGGSGGGYSGGGHYGSYSGGGGSGSYAWLIFGWGPFFMYMLATFDEPIIWGFNYLSTLIFWISGIVLYIVHRQSERTQVIAEIKRDCYHRILGYVWRGDAPSAKKDTDSKTWAGTPYSYRIVFYDKEFGEENAIKVKELIDRTPKIVWWSYKVWIFIYVIGIVAAFFLYELVIPFFENAIMSDAAFYFFDHLVFYFPAIVCALSAITALVIVFVKDSLLYECALRIVQDNNATEKRVRTETSIADRLSEKWYYNTCKNCGADADFSQRFCNKCGSSLEVHSFGGSYGGFHRITSGSKEK